MKIAQPYQCDYCKALKGQTNQWWLRDTVINAFCLISWSDTGALDANVEHICSESCASKALTKWMARQRITPDCYLVTPEEVFS